MFMPILRRFSNVSLFLRYSILFCPIISDFRFGRLPSFRHWRMNSRDFYVSSFLDTFNIIMLFSKGMDFIKHSSVSLFRTSFTIVTGQSFMHYIMPRTFSFDNSPFVRSNVSETPFNIASIFCSYFSGIYFDRSIPWRKDLWLPIITLLDFKSLFFLWGLKKYLLSFPNYLPMLFILFNLLLAFYKIQLVAVGEVFLLYGVTTAFYIWLS